MIISAGPGKYEGNGTGRERGAGGKGKDRIALSAERKAEPGKGGFSGSVF